MTGRGALALLAGIVLGWLVIASLLGERQARGADVALAPGSALEKRPATRPYVELELPSERTGEGQDVAQVEPDVEPTDAVDGASIRTASPGVLVFGRVTDSAGSPLEGIRVGQLDGEGRWDGAQTDASGRYTYGPLDPNGENPRVLMAWQMEYFRVEHEVALPFDVDAVRVDFQLKVKRVIWVRVELGSMPEPRPFLLPVATAEDPGTTFDGVRGSLNNQFGIGTFWGNGQYKYRRDDRAWVGTVTLEREGPVWISLVTEGQVVAKKDLGPDADEVTFEVDAAVLSSLHAELFASLVADEDGHPLQGRATLNDDPFMFGQPTMVGTDGRMVMTDARLGPSWLVIAVEGRARLRLRVNLERGQSLDLGELRLKKPIALSGHVIDDEGKPLAAILRWGRLDGLGKFAWVSQESARSHADGSFKIPGLEPALWYVQVRGLPAEGVRFVEPSRVSEILAVDGRAGDVDGVLLRAPKTTAVTVVIAAEKPMPVVKILDGAGLPVVHQEIGWLGDKTVLHLLPGQYVFELEREGHPVDRRELLVGSEELLIEL